MSLNVGVLGHVDSGKTTLTKALAEVASTAAFDKHADSSGRRNTIDLGFSSLTVADRRLVLIDCPGHAGLIKAVLAASTVFDMALVVVNALCGIQPQTSEHLLLCSIICPERVIIVLNKVDLVKEDEIPLVAKKVRKALTTLGIAESSPIVPVSLVNPTNTSMSELIGVLERRIFEPHRVDSGRLVVAVDHCFPLTGKGTVMTGTVIDGTIRLNQEIEIPVLKEKKKVKGLESWKTAVEQVPVGERAAILVQQLRADSISRTMICSPGALVEMSSCIASVEAIRYYRGVVSSGMKVHISTGFDTVMAECHFLRSDGEQYEQLVTLESPCICWLSFDRVIYTRPSAFYIASKLDHQGRGCRFLFHGQLGESLKERKICRFVRRQRIGRVERVENVRSIVCNSLFKKETKISAFEGLPVILDTGETGKIVGAFGKGGKARVEMTKPLSQSTVEKIAADEAVEVTMHLKKYLGEKKF
ncbi:Protein of unknown function (DUF663) [Parelaphostrongylus tenuis]|uniref:Tr-type G domain-containing protein n=1 Tax=Parelaphostrongylus tenuis TaxID=148309 RepID=A0AAD5N292_PARTN|nr:Protein of unknown function (DUF663) [Parelaphostrongylus tenuis]